MNQVAFSFDRVTLGKIGRGFLIALGGAALTYFAQFLSSTDFGSWTPLAVMLASVLVNAGKEYFSGN